MTQVQATQIHTDFFLVFLYCHFHKFTHPYFFIKICFHLRYEVFVSSAFHTHSSQKICIHLHYEVSASSAFHTHSSQKNLLPSALRSICVISVPYTFLPKNLLPSALRSICVISVLYPYCVLKNQANFLKNLLSSHEGIYSWRHIFQSLSNIP